jgi:hypothetical protein
MDINGEWYNELGSKMIIKVNGATITGKNHTAVGDADGVYELVGRLSASDRPSRTLGFVVTWQNEKRKKNSATTWCGEAREVSGQQFITTTWLLTTETAPADDWKSTLVGKDLFTRLPPDAQQVASLKALRGPSHHLKA